jgi:CBS domain-containing protein
LQGLVTDRDIVVGAVAESRDLDTATVGDVMSKEVIYCYEDDTLDHAAQLMADRQVRRILVVNRDKRFVGIISLGDLAQVERTRIGKTLSEVSEQDHREPARH